MKKKAIVKMFEEVFDTGIEELDCARCAMELEIYAEVVLAEEDPIRRFPAVAAHLTRCPNCTAEYEELLDVLRLAQTDELPADGPPRPFDLGFLAREETAPSSWVDLEGRVRRFFYAIPVLALRELKRLGQTPSALQVAYAPVGWGALRDEERERETVAFHLLDEEKGLRLDVQVARVSPELVWLALRPFDLVTEGPATGARISLCDPAGDPMEMRIVGPEGATQFKDVSLGRAYHLRVEHRDQVWEVELNLK